MRIIYFGSSEFSLVVLREIVSSGFTPILVVSQPDKPKGRGLKLQPTEVSYFANKSNIALINPVSIKTEEIENTIKGYAPDLFMVADYGKILPKALLKIPKIAAFGVHPSMLPRYRGSAPINWALLNGDRETGVTIFRMDETLDGGEILLQNKIIINDNDNIITLNKKLALESAKAAVRAIQLVENGNYKFIAQKEVFSSLAPKLKKQDGNIKWSLGAGVILNLIRATLGWPSAYTYFKGNSIQIIDAEVIRGLENQEPSVIIKIDKEGIYVSTGKDALKIKRLKPQGKKEMTAYAFAIGHHVSAGNRFDTFGGALLRRAQDTSE